MGFAAMFNKSAKPTLILSILLILSKKYFVF